jgi:murein DD-endopeptidase MepM/ murein hydrolase activator NlpD
MRILLISFLTLISLTGNSQQIIDTIESDQGTMIVFANRTWTYVEDLNFDGIMNHYVADQVDTDSNLHYIQSWDHDMCYTSNLANNVNAMKDTIWLCLENSESDSLDGLFHMPTDGNITSRFGWRRGRNHNGTDLDLNTGDTVRAAWGGKVRYAKYNTSGFGNLVIIRHHNGLETFYAHLSKHLVVPNQTVEPGDPIGLGGNTGHSYGSHLHFEVRFYDIPMNPEKIIDFKKGIVRDENLMVHRGLFKPGGYTSSGSGSAVASGDKKYYRVRSGDTLGAIASRNRTTVSRICQLNGIRPTTVLQIGKNLRIR